MRLWSVALWRTTLRGLSKGAKRVAHKVKGANPFSSRFNGWINWRITQFSHSTCNDYGTTPLAYDPKGVCTQNSYGNMAKPKPISMPSKIVG